MNYICLIMPKKSDLKWASGLANLKSDVDDLDIDKLKTALLDLSRRSIVARNNVVKKTAYDELVEKANA